MSNIKVKHLTPGSEGYVLTTLDGVTQWLPNTGGGLGGFSGFGIVERQFEVFFANTTHARPIEYKVGLVETLQFDDVVTNSIDFSMELPSEIDVTYPTQLSIVFHMQNSSTGTVKLSLEYEVVDENADTIPGGLSGTVTAVIDPPETSARERLEYAFNLPANALTNKTESIRFRLIRDAADTTNDTHPAKLNVEDVAFRYTGFGAPTVASGLSGFSGSAHWFDKYTPIENPNDYVAYPTSSSTLAMNFDLTPIIKVGYPIRWVHQGNTRYGMVVAITPTVLTIHGAALPDNGDPISDLAYGLPELLQVSSEQYFVAGRFADQANTTLMQSDMKTFIRWNLPSSYLVKILIRATTPDSGANQPNVNVSINSLAVCTSNFGAGLSLNTGAAWQETSVDLDTSRYHISYGDSIEVRVDGSGSNKDAENLTVCCVFVLE
jgi:hypothetical protein